MPHTLLAIDTATEICSVAIAVDGRVTELAETVGQRHSERILPMADEMLQGAGLRLGDCDAIAFGAGPGAFTGLRIACGIAQGLAFAVDKPIVAIGNLAALALAARAAAPGARRILAAIDARMQEAYWAMFSVDGGRPVAITAPALATASELASIGRRWTPDLLAGNAWQAFPDAGAGLDIVRAPDARAGAREIATLAVAALAAGDAVPAARAAPIYVRDRVALTIEERQAAARAR